MNIKKFLLCWGMLFGWLWALSAVAQNAPVVIAFFRPGDTYTLCFNRDIDYKESWDNIARRYNLSKLELARFNRVTENAGSIKQRSIFIPLIFNVNLFMYTSSEPNVVYIPIYYLIKNKQKVSSLHLRFREPMLTFIKNYNKIKDHYILNKDAPIFVGYLKVNKAYGWNLKSAKNLDDYKTYEQVQVDMQESANLSKLKEYSVKEKSLMLTKDGNRINTGAVSVIGVNRPTEQIANKIIEGLALGLREENTNFTSYIRREQIEEERAASRNMGRMGLVNRQNNIAARRGGLARGETEDRALPFLPNRRVERGRKLTSYSFFETEYKEELENGKVEEKLIAKVKLFRLLFDESNAKFYVLVTGTSPGSTVKITNMALNKTIFAKVISNAPQSIDAEEGKTVVVSEKGAEALGLKDGAMVEIVLLR